MVDGCWLEEGQECHPSRGSMGEVDLEEEACRRSVDVVLELRSSGSWTVETLNGPLAGEQMAGWNDSVEEVGHSQKGRKMMDASEGREIQSSVRRR